MLITFMKNYLNIMLLEVCNDYSYKLRIESMLLKEEFAANMSYLEPSISSMIVAGEGMYMRWFFI